MPEFHARAAMLPEGWAEDVLIAADAAGWITAVTPGAPPGAADRLRARLPARRGRLAAATRSR